MAIRIMSKKKFRFRFGGEQFISQGQNVIEDAPDWIVKDGLFELAVKEGSLAQLDTTPVIAVAETKKPEPAKAPEPKPAPVKKAPPKKTAAKKK